jgi:1,4-alpha-glucan branching enzyme
MMTTTVTVQDSQQPQLTYIPSHFPSHLESNGVYFSVWQPNAKQVCVVGPFNGWDGRWHTMIEKDGYWFLYIPEFAAGADYKYEVMTQDYEAYLQSASPSFPTNRQQEPVFSRRLVL